MRYPWANANRIADDHALDVAAIERTADRRAHSRGATEVQTAQGAAINGVYHPPVAPYEGHGEDAVFQPFYDGNSHWKAWWVILALGVAAVLAVLCADAHAMDRNDAIAKCATAVDGYLRDPATAQYRYSESLTTSHDADNWSVVIPVRAQNAFGGFATQNFGCLIAGGHVVKVLH